jgi:2-polyprenyl-6-methoxyphenol hydroxylase-like FAD-dependent oxidoreductase
VIESFMNTLNTQILVVGAGPVGLCAALAAVRRGLEVEVIDQSWRGYAPGHAALLHPSSLRLLADLEVADPLTAAGRRIDRIALYVDGACAATLELPSPVLAVPQRTLEETLLGALRGQGVQVRAPLQATTVEQGGDRIHVRVVRRELVTLGSPAHYSEWQALETSVVHAEHLIGADGYDSRVRAALGIEMLEVGAAETFAMFELPEPDGASPGIAIGLTQGLVSAGFPLPGGRARWGFQIDSELSEVPDVERLRRLFAERAPWRSDRPEAIDWGTVTHFERRLARPFGQKHAWLAGDAAHVTSPFGGQSMNVGLSEAYGLVQRIADSAHGRKAQEVLNQYEASRQREWHKLLGVNVHFDLLRHAPPWLAAHAREIVPALPASGRDLELLLERLGLVVR